MKKVTGKFVRERIVHSKSLLSYQKTGEELSVEYRNIIKNGRVVYAEFNEDDSCKIIYEVTGRFLRERIRGNFRR